MIECWELVWDGEAERANALEFVGSGGELLNSSKCEVCGARMPEAFRSSSAGRWLVLHWCSRCEPLSAAEPGSHRFHGPAGNMTVVHAVTLFRLDVPEAGSIRPDIRSSSFRHSTASTGTESAGATIVRAARPLTLQSAHSAGAWVRNETSSLSATDRAGAFPRACDHRAAGVTTGSWARRSLCSNGNGLFAGAGWCAGCPGDRRQHGRDCRDRLLCLRQRAARRALT
jgi:hypothetical protein